LGLACVLTGTVTSFEQETLDELYPRHSDYLRRVTRISGELMWEQLLLWEDSVALIHEGNTTDIGRPSCGLGAELRFLRPPLLWLGGPNGHE
jgi:hypothetical protein